MFSDDEEVSLVIDTVCHEGAHVADVDHAAADAPDDDTLSVGPDMPDLPLDVPPDPETSTPPGSTTEASTAEEVRHPETIGAEAASEVEQGTLEEEFAAREESSSPEPQVEPDLEAGGEEGQNSGVVVEEEATEERQQEEEREEQRRETAEEAEEGIAEEVKEDEEETQAKPESDITVAGSTDHDAPSADAPSESNITSQETLPGAAEGAPQGGTEEAPPRSRSPCTCQTLFTNCTNSRAPSRRKNRPCSLPVSELETVIASACGEPETPRSHYIRIHHLLHSLPSAQQRAPSQEDEEVGEGENTSTIQDTTSTSPTLKSSKDREEEDEDEEDTMQTPTQVGSAKYNSNSRCDLTCDVKY